MRLSLFLAVIQGGLALAYDHTERNLDAIPVHRYADHHAIRQRRALRLARHEDQIKTYRRNMMDKIKVATHDEVLLSARSMEEAMKRRKRGPGDTHSQPMMDYFNGGVDILYTLPAAIGTPGQILNLVPDTGSADLWIPWERSNMALDHNTFAPNSSSTFSESNRTFVAQYGKGKAEGIVVLDSVQMGGLSVRQQVFGVAVRVDEQFQKQPNDGIMAGFCSSILSKYPSRTFFENLVIGNSPVLADPYFSVFLTRGRDIQPSVEGLVEGSELCLGCMAKPVNSSTRGNMLMIPVSTFAFFQVQQDFVSINGTKIPGTACQAMMDTGTTDIYLPIAVADALMAPLRAKRLEDGSYIISRSALPPSTRIALSYGGQAFDVNWLDLINGFVDESRTAFLLNIVGADTQGPNGEPLAIIGDTFLKNVISVYHYSYNGAPAIGLQQIVSNSASAQNSAAVSGQVAQSTAVVPAPSGRLGTTGASGPSLTLSAVVSVSSAAPAGSSSSAAGQVMRQVGLLPWFGSAIAVLLLVLARMPM